MKTSIIERRLDRFDQRRTLHFIESNVSEYHKHFAAFEQRKPGLHQSMKGLRWQNEVDEVRDLSDHVLGYAGSLIISMLPVPFQQLSLLKVIDYKHADWVYVPQFGKDAEFKGVEAVHHSVFPRETDHNSRIQPGAIGDGVMYPTHLPRKLSSNRNVRFYFQLHAFFRNFFHSIELPRRDPQKRQTVTIETKKASIHLGTWWKEFENVCMNRNEPFPSWYTETVADDLTPEVHVTDYVRFTAAAAEVMAEAFVNYNLGIIPCENPSVHFSKRCPKFYWLMYALATAKAVHV